jgi:hypothetical protein
MIWLLRREYARWLWHHRGITVGQFLDLLRDAPEWLERDTTPFWRRPLRRD